MINCEDGMDTSSELEGVGEIIVWLTKPRDVQACEMEMGSRRPSGIFEVGRLRGVVCSQELTIAQEDATHWLLTGLSGEACQLLVDFLPVGSERPVARFPLPQLLDHLPRETLALSTVPPPSPPLHGTSSLMVVVHFCCILLRETRNSVLIVKILIVG